jgi:hypothetical protein
VSIRYVGPICSCGKPVYLDDLCAHHALLVRAFPAARDSVPAQALEQWPVLDEEPSDSR